MHYKPTHSPSLAKQWDSSAPYGNGFPRSVNVVHCHGQLRGLWYVLQQDGNRYPFVPAAETKVSCTHLNLAIQVSKILPPKKQSKQLKTNYSVDFDCLPLPTCIYHAQRATTLSMAPSIKAGTPVWYKHAQYRHWTKRSCVVSPPLGFDSAFARDSLGAMPNFSDSAKWCWTNEYSWFPKYGREVSS